MLKARSSTKFFFSNIPLNTIRIIVLFLSTLLLNSNCSVKTKHQAQNSKLLEQRKAEIDETLAKDIPVIKIKQSSYPQTDKIQDIFFADERLKNFLVDNTSKQKMLNEVFSISNARPTDLPRNSVHCVKGNCARIEMYNYAINGTVVAVVDPLEGLVTSLEYYKDMSPDVPPHLVDLAIEIARNDTSVIHAYGEDYKNSTPLMSGSKTALNRTKCQRSKHLCVAPTFVKGDKALWAIVDLTDLNIAGVKWTSVGETGMAVTQRNAQNAKIMDCYCDKLIEHKQEAWSFKYTMSRSDGLVVSDIEYNNRKLFRNVKLVDWHVSYSKTDGFGYSDAVGCPEFSTAAVLAVEPPYFEPILEGTDTIGFLLGQQYYSEGWPTPCNYNYHQFFEFYNDGRFRPVFGSIGRGCGNNGVYRPVLRVALAVQSNASEWKSDTWSPWKKEQWTLQMEHSEFTNNNAWFKIDEAENKGMYVLANTGQFRTGSRGDNAYIYITHWDQNKDEGETDLPTIGPCCNIDYKQGPEKFIESNPESIENNAFVLWYVAQMTNDDTKGKEYCWAESVLKNGVFKPIIYPCYAGPMFKPY